MKKIIVSDVTPVKSDEFGKKLTFREKLGVASAIDAIGADIINLPALIDSKENEVIYRTIAENVKGAVVAVDVGDKEDGISVAYECIKGAKNPSLIVSFPVSTTQMEYMYHKKSSAMVEKIVGMCEKALSMCPSVEFVARDATRAEDGILENLVEKLSNCGVYAITLTDDAGIAFPEDFANMVKKVKSVSNMKVFVETNDKLSMAVSCAVEAIKAGADGVKTSVIGGGMTPSEFSDVLRARGLDYGFESSLDVTKIHDICASIKEQKEEVSVEDVKVSTKLNKEATIGEVSAFVKKLGYELTDEDNGKVYEEFKRVVLKKELMGAKEMEAIVASTAMQVPSTYHLVNYIVNSGNVIPPTANIILEKNGEKLSGVSTGDGPVDAAFQAIEQVIGHHYELDDFQVQSVTKGREAVGSCIIRLRANGKLYSGNGVSTDIIGACIRAFINALNKIVYEEN